jgi:hypothetical protein
MVDKKLAGNLLNQAKTVNLRRLLWADLGLQVEKKADTPRGESFNVLLLVKMKNSYDNKMLCF